MTDVATNFELDLSTEKIAAIVALGEQVNSLQLTLPKNSDELPLAYVDPQILAETGFLDGKLDSKRVDSALVQLDYLEGYPIVDGLPFWERLDGETNDYYQLFKSYRNQKDTGFTRTLTAVSKRSNISFNAISAISKVYHWRARVRAYDIFKAKELDAIREKNISTMENRHRKAAEELFITCMTSLKDKFASESTNPLKMMSAKEVKDLLEVAYKLERLSLGKHPEKPLDSDDRAVVNTVIKNYQINRTDSSRAVNINKDAIHLGKVVDVLFQANALDEAIEDRDKIAKAIATPINDVSDASGGNGKGNGSNIIDIKAGIKDGDGG